MTIARVAHLTTVHSRRDVRVFEKQACSLAEAGFDVHLVVGDGRGDEIASGVHVHDIGVAAGGRLGRMIIQPLRCWRVARRLKARIYHFHDPELLGVGLALRAAGAQVIYDSHEDVPRDILSKDYLAPWLRRTVGYVFEHFEDFAAARLSAVVAAWPRIAQRFERVNPVTVVINNYPTKDERKRVGNGNRMSRTVCYVGGIGLIRGVIEMVRAMAMVDARLIMAGSFESASTEAQARALPGWSKVDYRGTVSREEVRSIMSESCAGLVLFHPEPNHVSAQPNKMFEYMSAGLAVIASDFPLWRQLVVGAGAGLCVDPLDPGATAAAICQLLDEPERTREMGERGRAAVESCYRWDGEAAKLCDLYQRLLVSN